MTEAARLSAEKDGSSPISQPTGEVATPSLEEQSYDQRLGEIIVWWRKDAAEESARRSANQTSPAPRTTPPQLQYPIDY